MLLSHLETFILYIAVQVAFLAVALLANASI